MGRGGCVKCVASKVPHLALVVVAAFLRNASIGHVNLNSMSEVTGASTSRLHEAAE